MIQVDKTVECGIGLDSKIYETGYLIDSDLFQAFDNIKALLRRSKQAACLKITFECPGNYRIQFFFSQIIQSVRCVTVPGNGLGEGWKLPRGLLD